MSTECSVQRDIWITHPRWKELKKNKPQLSCPKCSSNRVSPKAYGFHTLRDVSLDIPTRIIVETVWYMCHECSCLFRGENPEGVSPHARFTDRAKEALRTSYLEDNLSSRQVSKRVARDFRLKADHVTVLRTSKEAQPAKKIYFTCSGVVSIDGLYVKVGGEERVIIIIVDVIERRPLITEMHLGEDRDAMRSALTALKKMSLTPIELFICDFAEWDPEIERLFPEAKIQKCHFHALKLLNKAILKEIQKTLRENFGIEEREISKIIEESLKAERGEGTEIKAKGDAAEIYNLLRRTLESPGEERKKLLEELLSKEGEVPEDLRKPLELIKKKLNGY